MQCPNCGHEIELPKHSEKPATYLTAKQMEQANAKVTAIIDNALTQTASKYPNRDKFPEPMLWMADLYRSLTGQEPTKRVIYDWINTFNEWLDENLTAADIKAAYQHSARPDGGFLVGRPGALTVTAIALKSKRKQMDHVDRSAIESTQKMLERKETNFTPMPDDVRAKLGKLKQRMEIPNAK